jgi:sulfonate transport system permease protein
VTTDVITEPSAGVPALKKRRRRWWPSRAARRRLRRVLSPLLLVGVWWLVTEAGWVDTTTIPSPEQVWDAFKIDWNSGELLTGLGVSLGRAMQGLAIGLGTGLVLGTLSGMLRLGEDLVDPVVQMFRTVPFVALSSVFIVWFGIGESPKIALVAVATFFPIYLNTYTGIRNVDARLVEMARGFGASPLVLARDVVLRGALPQALLGLRLALGVSWLALVFAEQINADAGIGSLLAAAQSRIDTPAIFEAIMIYALLGIVTDAIVRILEARLLRWRVGFTGQGA